LVDNQRMKASRLALAIAVLFGGIAVAAQTDGQPTITTASIEICAVDQSCYQQLHASGGTTPLHWRITSGSLPEGLQLDAPSGVISGIATSAADYEVAIQVSDSSNPPRTASRTFRSKTVPALVMDWKAAPTLQATTISGSLTVSNNGDDVLDLTVIVVAVNNTGKAFALSYQHFDLAAKTTEQRITFSSQLPAGRYTVRADAIGEVAARRKIYRAAREAGAFQVPAQ
jgi:hypothetical protein